MKGLEKSLSLIVVVAVALLVLAALGFIFQVNLDRLLGFALGSAGDLGSF